MSPKSSYFLISVSTKENLDLCIRHALAGFPNGPSGLWTFSEINKGDFISFLFGAKAHNLYRVKEKIAVKNAENLPPWKQLIHKTYKKTYWFPFRLQLEPVREFQESLVRNEFSYVAENLLLRGGYRKTHFQADETTLRSVSEMGRPYSGKVDELDIKYETFVPKFTLSKTSEPDSFKLRELVLQSAIRQNVSKGDKLKEFLDKLDVKGLHWENLEVLGEKALPEGHVDILIKETPIGISKKLVIEIKMNKAIEDNLEQTKSYIEELGKECIAGILIAKDFQKKVINEAKDNNIKLVKYSLDKLNGKECFTFDELMGNIDFKIL